MAYRARVVIPTSNPESDRVVAQLCREASHEFGGYSTYEGSGGWVSPSNDLIEEPHTVVEVVCQGTRPVLEEFVSSATDTIKTELDETEVLVQVEEITAEFW